MQCLEFRQLKLTDPYVNDQDANEHRDVCTACRAFEREIQNLDATTKEALSVDVPEGFAAKILLNQALQPQQRRPTRSSWLGMAASFFALAIGSVAYLQLSRAPIEVSVLEHIEHEQVITDRKLEAAHIQQVMYSVDAESSALPGEIIYASNCIIDGELVAHLVVRDKDQELTLVLIPHNQITGAIAIQTGDWHGVIQPHATGSLAILARSELADIEGAAAQYGRAIRKRTI